LRTGLGVSGTLLVGCNAGEAQSMHPEIGDAGSSSLRCRSPFDGCVFQGTLPFVDESTVALEVAFDSGLDGRLYTDLSRVTPSEPLVSNERFYVRTRVPELPSDGGFTLRISGLDGALAELDVEELRDLARPQGAHVLECSGNGRGASFGLMSSAEWEGVRLLDLLDELEVPRGQTRVLVTGFDEHAQPSRNNHSVEGASWIFGWEDLEATGAFLATRMNGQPLPKEHGAPVRLYVPGWYGCTCIKWVNEVTLVDDAAPATTQMTEFAERTHQRGTPALARDFAPVRMDVAAMPTRAERWRCDGHDVLRLFGIVWGVGPLDVPLSIELGERPAELVTRCGELSSVAPWSFWEHRIALPPAGDYPVRLRVPDPNVRTRRLDSGFYERVFRV
jgi:DMSO/TMAO reductase YedYZ molybdopterin-dependent catalytic subunit